MGLPQQFAIFIIRVPPRLKNRIPDGQPMSKPNNLGSKSNQHGHFLTMSGIYIHIPYCKQACHYCDFFFSTRLNTKGAMARNLVEELRLRRDYLDGATVNSIYFGGGTPSLLSEHELGIILQGVSTYLTVSPEPEITLEVNPDDVTPEKAAIWLHSGINRISLGVQSFFDQDLKLMNRAHDAEMARSSIQLIRDNFPNYSIDLIYGMPDMTKARWEENVEIALGFSIPHLSAYALTVEPGTALKHFIDQQIIAEPGEDLVATHFNTLVSKMEAAGYVHYEVSNFSKPGFFSQNNTAYWKGMAYLGIGPSAHSFNGLERSWNVRNNRKYMDGIASGKPILEVEKLSVRDRYNEKVMTGLRTKWGVSLKEVEKEFGTQYRKYLMQQAGTHIKARFLNISEDVLFLTPKGKFLADGIASDLFMINLK